MDDSIKIVNAKEAREFERAVNVLLKEGNWRVAETEMSIVDSHYWAMLIHQTPDLKRGPNE